MFRSAGIYNFKQECISVRCVLSTTVAVFKTGRCLPRGCLSGGGVSGQEFVSPKNPSLHRQMCRPTQVAPLSQGELRQASHGS